MTTCTAVADHPVRATSRRSPRASSDALRALFASGPTVAEARMGRVLAGWAHRATDADARRLKVRPGDVVTVCYQRTLAALLGVHPKHVCRVMRGLKERGVVEVIQTGRVTRTYRWRTEPAETLPVTADVTAEMIHEEIPRPDPVRGADRTGLAEGRPHGRTTVCRNRDRRLRLKAPDRASPMRTCPDCGHRWPADTGSACYPCDERRCWRQRFERCIASWLAGSGWRHGALPRDSAFPKGENDE